MKGLRGFEWTSLAFAVAVWALVLGAKSADYDFNILLLGIAFLLSVKFSIFALILGFRATRFRLGALLFLLTSSPPALYLTIRMLEPSFAH